MADEKDGAGVKARCPQCGATWTFSEDDVRALKDDLLSGVEEESFLCGDCSAEFSRNLQGLPDLK